MAATDGDTASRLPVFPAGAPLQRSVRISNAAYKHAQCDLPPQCQR